VATYLSNGGFSERIFGPNGFKELACGVVIEEDIEGDIDLDAALPDSVLEE